MKLSEELSTGLREVHLTEELVLNYFDIEKTKLNGQSFVTLTLKPVYKGFLASKIKNSLVKLCQTKAGISEKKPIRFHFPDQRGFDSANVTNIKTVVKPIKAESDPTQIITVPLSCLICKYSPRFKRKPCRLQDAKLDKEHVDRIVEAIKAGQKLPLPKVRPFDRNAVMKEPLFEIVDGEHTCMAYLQLGFTEVKVERKKLTHRQALFGALKWNMNHGLPLTPLQEARHIQRILQECEGVTQKDVAEDLGYSPAWVSNRLSLLKMCEGEEFTRVNSTHARKIVTANEQDQMKIARKVDLEGMSTRATEELVETLRTYPKSRDIALEAPYSSIGYDCALCNGRTFFPVRRGGKRVCPKCANKIDENPSLLIEREEPTALRERIHLMNENAKKVAEVYKVFHDVSDWIVQLAKLGVEVENNGIHMEVLGAYDTVLFFIDFLEMDLYLRFVDPKGEISPLQHQKLSVVREKVKKPC